MKTLINLVIAGTLMFAAACGPKANTQPTQPATQPTAQPTTVPGAPPP